MNVVLLLLRIFMLILPKLSCSNKQNQITFLLPSTKNSECHCSECSVKGEKILLISPPNIVSVLFLIIHFIVLTILQTVIYQNSLTSLLDENAVSFAQAEKLYYETSLISVGNELQSTQTEPGKCIGCHYFVQ